jgi:Oxidoreductase family, NAD-binding Rossmann fold
MIRLGMIGSGFVADFYMQGLVDVPGQQVVANYYQTRKRAQAFGEKWGVPHQHASMDELCARDDVDIVLIALPNAVHVEAVRVAAAAGKAMACTKPLGRNADESAEMVQLVREAKVMTPRRAGSSPYRTRQASTATRRSSRTSSNASATARRRERRSTTATSSTRSSTRRTGR